MSVRARSPCPVLTDCYSLPAMPTVTLNPHCTLNLQSVHAAAVQIDLVTQHHSPTLAADKHVRTPEGLRRSLYDSPFDMGVHRAFTVNSRFRLAAQSSAARRMQVPMMPCYGPDNSWPTCYQSHESDRPWLHRWPCLKLGRASSVDQGCFVRCFVAMKLATRSIHRFRPCAGKYEYLS